MDRVIKNKNKQKPVTLQVKKQVQKNLFIRRILSDQVWGNVKQLLSHSNEPLHLQI